LVSSVYKLIFLTKMVLLIAKNQPGGLVVFWFALYLRANQKKKSTLRSLRLERSGR
jgi:hypothetical protein